MDTKEIRFGIQLRPGSVSDIVHQSILCEKYGFDSVWWMDHFVAGGIATILPELYCTLTAIGINTSKVIVGSAATDTLRRHPATIAQSLATVDHILGGRTALGVGAGEAMNLLPFGISMRNQYNKLREALQTIKLLFTADHTQPAIFKGKFYRLQKAYLQIKPVSKPHPPIYIGAFGPKMLELVGELGDGWIPFSHTPKTYKECLNGPIKRGANKVGRDFSEIEPAFLPATAISEDQDQAREMIEIVAKRLLALLPVTLRKIVPQAKHPGKRYTLAYWMNSPALSDRDKEIFSMIAQDIPTETALKTVIWGTPDDCIDQIEQYIKAGCRHVIFGIRGKNYDESIKLLGKRVMPYFGLV